MFDFFIEETNPGKSTQPHNKPPKENQLKRLIFTKPGTKKYKFILESEISLNSMIIKTKVETSWILQVLNITEDEFVLSLVAYDYVLKDCNDKGFAELYQITRQFQKLYDDITVSVDHHGNLKKVLNHDQLVHKWEDIKQETVQYFGDQANLDQFLAVDNETFSTPEFLQKIIREVEFFFVYLQAGGYGQKFSSYRELQRENAFRTGQITWDLDFSGKNQITYDKPIGEMKVSSFFQPGKNWIKEAYGKMPFLEIDKIKPNFELKGHYEFNSSSGWIKNAWLDVNEIVHPQLLFHKLKYKIQEI